ncbi:hypothetical protein DRE_03710 [Drechslerella stenobrocha 248]|uniref:Uncharacterized protein n=1 Tax=Drechslerella stenobrocha 248 TaxID=1043628 RepID=W7I401_9PEZI|nr:hypothetical protein DRE_03710 [Drechslerella stenobrocha 248]
MQRLTSLRALITPPTPLVRPAVITRLPGPNRWISTTPTAAAQPKVPDTAGKKSSGGAAEGEEHNKLFGDGKDGPIWRTAGRGQAKPKIHDAIGKFEGVKSDVERHNREFRESFGRRE